MDDVMQLVRYVFVVVLVGRRDLVEDLQRRLNCGPG